MTDARPAPAVVTGAGGFVGCALAGLLGAPANTLSLGSDRWREAMAGVPWRGAVVYHLAARVHGRGAGEADFQHDNVEKTRALAEAAAAGGARRLVFLSSVKVNGEETHATPFRPDDAPAPEDAYGRSKRDAEAALLEIAQAGALEVAIVRSPLVIGPGAKGNLVALKSLADSGFPLPFASIANRRTFVDVADLAALLAICASHPAAAGGTWMAGDPDPVSTARLFTVTRRALGREPRLFPVPRAALEAAAAVLGVREKMRRLTRSLEVDVSRTRDQLGWVPRVAMDDALAAMARSWRA